MSRSKIIIIISVVIFLVIDVILFTVLFKNKQEEKRTENAYQEAVSEYNRASEEYDAEGLKSAKEKFLEISEYSDSKEYITRIDDDIQKIDQYSQAVEAYTENQYTEAYKLFESIQGYRETDSYIQKMSEGILKQASSYVETEQYDSAMSLLLTIPEYTDTYYADAMQMYNSIEGIRAEKEKAKKYDSAVGKYENGDLRAAQSGFMEIRDYRDSADYLEKIGNALYGKAKELYEQKAYGQAISCLEPITTSGTWSGSQSAVTLKTEIRDTCVNEAISEAEKNYRSTYDVDQSVDILIRAQQEVGNDERLQEVIDDFRMNYMVYLVDMELFSSEYKTDNMLDGGIYVNEHLVSNYGKTYKNSITISGGYISYLTSERNFSRLKATVACPKNAMDSNGFHKSAYIQIYGKKGETMTLLHTTAEFKNDTSPEELDLDISGYDAIYFQWTCIGINIWHCWGEFATLYDARFLR